MGIIIKKTDKVKVDNKNISPEKKIYILLNKPKDYITTNKDTHNRKIVIDLIKNVKERIFSIGRLDRKTTGLLLLTNDGELSKKLTHPSHKIKKIYSLQINKPITKNDFNKLKEGIEIDNEKTPKTWNRSSSTIRLPEFLMTCFNAAYLCMRNVRTSLSNGALNAPNRIPVYMIRCTQRPVAAPLIYAARCHDDDDLQCSDRLDDGS